MRTLFIAFVILLLMATSAAADIKVLDSMDLEKEGDFTTAGVKTLCIDGQKFVYAFGWAAMGTARGVGKAGGVTLIQVYEEKGGKVVPAKCN